MFQRDMKVYLEVDAEVSPVFNLELRNSEMPQLSNQPSVHNVLVCACVCVGESKT